VRRADTVSRLIDVVLASTLLVLLMPLMVGIAVLVRVTSRGPALFRQVRLGHHKQPFVMLKFRSMAADCGDAAHREFVRRLFGEDDPRDGRDGLYKLGGDSRVTWLGRILRATSIDELPQLVNVVRGEMSLVGPRPALAWELELYEPHHHERFTVKPGMTGLWQVSGRSRLTAPEALRLDVEYARRRTVALDLAILVRTVPALFSFWTAR
jgi:lipopolysaccharide/colanic/teichoic acid biosynthesis glycosyltransferase